MPNTQKEQSKIAGKRHKRAGYKRQEMDGRLKAWREVDLTVASGK